MQIPIIHGRIDRRILVNFRIDPDVAARVLPPPFQPKLSGGYAIGGICLIRLRAVRPWFVPLPWGIGSENAAHRIAVQWHEEGRLREGVYIPRRDTSSRLNVLAGGRLFPGIHHRARFAVEESDGRYSVALESEDGQTRVRVEGVVGERLPTSSVFSSLAEASAFFERGSLGYSATGAPGRYEALELRCRTWQVQPLEVEVVESSYFEDERQFLRGSVEIDCGLLMRGIEHQWQGRGELCCPAANDSLGNCP